MTNRQSVDASICVSVHVIAECRDFKLDAAARPVMETVAVIVCDLPEGGQSMKRQPDLLWILVILFGLGVVTTGYAQSLWTNKTDAPIEIAQQPQPFKR
ncbi:hypothetical protein RZO07_29630 [Pseudomonas protegens]|uniref:hypothetical protein n=1 Tax=Pseudomonas protegens TaxID=380021 RepID=UPI0029370EC8|nr:hypothetical protein [Pseudomonas protegens]WOE82781.1 hypothetical protein RZO07_29630 [Pseudomonas protegens]